MECDVSSKRKLPLMNDPFSQEKAFLGFAHRQPHLRYSFDGRRLVIREAWHVRAFILVVGAALGPGLTLAFLMGWVKPSPWYILALAIAFNVLAWVGWIDALRHSYRIVCDLTIGEMQFFFHPLGHPKYTLLLKTVADVLVETIHRPVGRGNPMRRYTDDEIKRRNLRTIDCFSVVLVRRDGERIQLAETTDRAVADAIREILLGALKQPYAKNVGEFLGTARRPQRPTVRRRSVLAPLILAIDGIQPIGRKWLSG
jgi:hypothetical protein